MVISVIERIQMISHTQTFKMLGVHFDEKLSFDYHCQKVINKISSALFMINRAKHMLSKSSLKRLYFAMIHPHLLYCLPIYSNTSPKNIDKIFKKQKQCIRIINNAKFNAHTEPLFYNSSILPFNELIIEQKLVLLHPIMHNYSKNFKNYQMFKSIITRCVTAMTFMSLEHSALDYAKCLSLTSQKYGTLSMMKLKKFL